MSRVFRQVVYINDHEDFIDNLSAVESFFGTCTNGRCYLGIFVHSVTNAHFELIDCTGDISSGLYSVGEIKYTNYTLTTLTELEKTVSEMVGYTFTLSKVEEDLSVLFELLNEER